MTPQYTFRNGNHETAPAAECDSGAGQAAAEEAPGGDVDWWRRLLAKQLAGVTDALGAL